jgi:MFS family permease
VSSASLTLTDRSLALSEPKAVGAQGSTKVLAASSLGSCIVFVSSAVVTVPLAAIGREMRLSPLDLQWVMNAELLPLAALTLVAGALGDRVRTEADLPRGDRSLWPGRTSPPPFCCCRWA